MSSNSIGCCTAPGAVVPGAALLPEQWHTACGMHPDAGRFPRAFRACREVEEPLPYGHGSDAFLAGGLRATPYRFALGCVTPGASPRFLALPSQCRIWYPDATGWAFADPPQTLNE